MPEILSRNTTQFVGTFPSELMLTYMCSFVFIVNHPVAMEFPIPHVTQSLPLSTLYLCVCILIQICTLTKVKFNAVSVKYTKEFIHKAVLHTYI